MNNPRDLTPNSTPSRAASFLGEPAAPTSYGAAGGGATDLLDVAGTPNIVGGYSEAFYNGNLRPGYTQAAYGYSFIQRRRTIRQFVDHVLSGNAVIPHRFKGNTRRNKTFDETQAFALDLESGERSVSVADTTATDFGQRYLFLVHATRSSGKVVPDHNDHGYLRSRGYGLFSEPIQGFGRASMMMRAVYLAAGLPADKASFKPAQPWFGSTNRNEEPHINVDAAPVNVWWVAGYLVDIARAEMERDLAPKSPTIRPTNAEHFSYVERKASAWLNRALDELATAGSGDRHDTLFKKGCWLAGLEKGGWLGDEWKAALRATALTVMGDQRAREIDRAIRDAERDAVPIELRLPAPRRIRVVQQGRDRTFAADTSVSPAPLKQPPLWQVARWNCVCREYTLLHINAVHFGISDDFTAPQLAERMWISPKKARSLIEKAVRWNLITPIEKEIGSDFDTKEGENSLPSKSAPNSRRGPKATHYHLTPHLADEMISRLLPDFVQELMQPSDPGIIYADEAAAAGVNDPDAIEAITRATSSTIEADEVTAEAERKALRIAREIERRAEIDETPFIVDALPSSVREVSTMAIERLIATDPDKVWKHSELMWVAGVTRHNIGALIAKSDKLVPAEQPTLIPVTFEGRKDLLPAMMAACKAQHGAPVAWIDEHGNTIEGFSPKPPPNARGGLINIGKKYLRSDQAAPASVQKPAEREITPTQEPTEEGKQRAARSRARGVILPRLRGCLLARGWKHIPGAYGYWERTSASGITCRQANTFDGMVEALMLDSEWAEQRRTDREGTERIVGSMEVEYGAVVTRLSA